MPTALVRLLYLVLLSGLLWSPAMAAADAEPALKRRAEPEPARLCGSRVALASVPLAENLAFGADGRLFVSGGQAVYELVTDSASASGYALRTLSLNPDNFTGLAVRNRWLYAASYEGVLYAAALDAAEPVLTPIHQLQMNAANGMAFDRRGALYIANGPLPTSGLPDPRIVRLRFADDAPTVVIEQGNWLQTGLLAPNGVRIQHGTLYWTDSAISGGFSATLRASRLDSDAPQSPPHRIAEQANALYDDFVPYADGFLVTSFWRGSLVQWGADGRGGYRVVAETAPGRFANPSSVRPVEGPLFPPGSWLVTEKGSLDGSSAEGNQLTLFTPQPCRE